VHREQDGHDHAVGPILPVLLASVALLDLVWAAVDLISLTGHARTALGGLVALTGVLLAAILLVVRRRQLGARAAHTVATVVVLSVGLNGAAGLAQTAEPQFAAWLVLAIAAAGALLLSRRWFLTTVLALWVVSCAASDLAIARGSGHHDTAVFAQLAVVMLAATAFAQLLHHWRAGSAAELAAARQRVADAEVRDSLTGVANTAGLSLLGGQVLEAARRHGDAVHCLVLDIDALGVVNHELGRLVGDEVLVSVADSLIGATRAGDVVARWGGDEFVVIGAGSGPSALEVERRVRAGVVESPPASPSVWPGRVSAGRAVKEPWDDDTLESLLERAHREMLLRRALRREASGEPYRPSSLDRSEQPPAQRPRPGAAPQAW
jgi:diguanylate cyclase (GGDEF)-like protein